MIKIKSKFIPSQPRNKKYLAVGGAVVSYGGGSSGSAPTNTIVVLPTTDKEYDVD
jgi:hypothetical protein